MLARIAEGEKLTIVNVDRNSKGRLLQNCEITNKVAPSWKSKKTPSSRSWRLLIMKISVIQICGKTNPAV